jgi:hypothetical protein
MKLREDLQKRGDEIRKKLESQGGIPILTGRTGPSAPSVKGRGFCLPACLIAERPEGSQGWLGACRVTDAIRLLLVPHKR